MRSQDEIVKRIGVLTAVIGAQQEELYNMALNDRKRKCIWEFHLIDKKIQRAYNELLVLEWVMGKEGE